MLLNMSIVRRLKLYGYFHVYGKLCGHTYNVAYVMSSLKWFIAWLWKNGDSPYFAILSMWADVFGVRQIKGKIRLDESKKKMCTRTRQPMNELCIKRRQSKNEWCTRAKQPWTVMHESYAQPYNNHELCTRVRRLLMEDLCVGFRNSNWELDTSF